MRLFGKRRRSVEGIANRRRWLELIEGLVLPFLRAAHEGELWKIFPEAESRLAAAAGVLCGVAPFLAAEPQVGEVDRYNVIYADARALIADVTSSDSTDCCCVLPSDANDTFGYANGLLAFALLRGKDRLIHTGAEEERKLLDYFERTRRSPVKPDADGLLFRAMVGLVISELGGTCDTQLLDYAITFLMRQSRGNGVFAPENGYRWSYSHTFFLYPAACLLTEYLPIWFGRKGEDWKREMRKAVERISVIQMRFLAPDGSFPVLGPEMWLRSGAFHTLAYAASRELLPRELSGAAVREALLQMAERTLTPIGTVDGDGFLLPGLCGYQPTLCGPEVLRGYLYGCMTVFAPLELPAYHDFWQNGNEKSPWDQMWAGENVPLDCDHN